MPKTVLTILDYSKAFDRVWREDLLIRAVNEGLPITCAQKGQSAEQRQGLPQGSVLSPLLSLLYIDDLRRVIPENMEVAVFAEDVSLITAEAAAQEAITNVAEWRRCR